MDNALAAQLKLMAGDPNAAARLLLTAGRRAMTTHGALVTAAAPSTTRALAPDGSPLAFDIDELRTQVAALARDVDTAFEVGTGVLDAAAEPARRARVHLRMAEAASAATRWTAAQEHLTAAAELTDADNAMLARIGALAAQCCSARNNRSRPRRRPGTRSRRRNGWPWPSPACQALEVLGQVAPSATCARRSWRSPRQLRTAETHELTSWVLRATHALGTIDLLATNRLNRLHKARALAADAGALSMVTTIDLQIAAAHQTGFEAPASLETARRCEHVARRWHLELPLAQALLYPGLRPRDRWPASRDGGQVGRRGRPRPLRTPVHAAIWASRALFRLLREDREAAVDAYETAMYFDRQVPIITVGPYGGEWALLSTVTNRGGDQARAEIRAVTAAGACMHEGYLLYADAVAAGQRGDPQQAMALFSTAQTKSPDVAPDRHGGTSPSDSSPNRRWPADGANRTTG